MVNKTAKQWRLFTDEPGCEMVAAQLNHELNRLIKEARGRIDQGMSRATVAEDVKKTMYAFMKWYTAYGARDTEPEWELVDAINEELGTNIDRW